MAKPASPSPCICKTSCAIATVFLIYMIYKLFMVDKSGVMKDFSNTLSPSLFKTYTGIISERRSIYFQGYLVGFLLSMVVIAYYYFSKNTKITKLTMLCSVIAITFVVSYFYYILHPKSDWMIKHLQSSRQREAWLKVYRYMQVQCHLGFGLGIVAVFLYGNSVCK